MSVGFHPFAASTSSGQAEETQTRFFKALNIKSRKPLAIIANTIKGKGINFMENNPEWHHKNLNQDLFKQIILKN